jgi:hypothetical protein
MPERGCAVDGARLIPADFVRLLHLQMEGGNALPCLTMIVPMDLAHCRYRVSRAF